MGKLMTVKKTSKTKVVKKQKLITPVVVEPKDKKPPLFATDNTGVTDFNIQNINYATEIIPAARKAFNTKRLKQEKKNGTEAFLREGERQIFKLWHSVVALDTHNTLFVTLFLISIGKILNEISKTLKPHEFSKWRQKTFHYKHERYLQQAQQLAKIGPFAEKYAAMGKKRLLALDHLRKTKKVDDCKELIKEHPLRNVSAIDKLTVGITGSGISNYWHPLPSLEHTSKEGEKRCRISFISPTVPGLTLIKSRYFRNSCKNISTCFKIV
jgi:hypothetical protein